MRIIYTKYIIKGISMTKEEFAKKIKEKLNLSSQVVAIEVINKFIEVITEAIKSGEEITLPTIGKFYVVEKEAMTCRHPKTGEMIEVPKRKAVKFKLSTNMKKIVNE